SWFDWENADDPLFAFTSRLIQFRREHPVFQRRRWFVGRALHGADVSDIGWFKPDGTTMNDNDWATGFARSLGAFFNGKAIPTPNERGDPICDDSFYILFNAHYEPLEFKLPAYEWGEQWAAIINTVSAVPDLREREAFRAGSCVKLEAHSMMVLRR